MKAYLTLQHGHRTLGTLHLELYDVDVPKTVANFASLLQRPAGKGYKGCSFHRVIKGFMAQGGDFTAGDGTGGDSIYGKSFPDENFLREHSRAGVLSMANNGADSNGSQFFITFKAAPHLDGKHVVFGHVDLTQSADVLDALEHVKCTASNNRPLQPVTIVECGIVQRNLPFAKEGSMKIASANALEDDDEIVLDEAEDDDDGGDASKFLDAEQGEEEQAPMSKAEAIKLRLRKLNQKINQARQLNKKAVKEEGERITDVDKERRRQAALAKKSKEATWEAANSKAVRIASENGIDAKALTQQAADSVKATRAKADKDELNRFQINDYHNSEGQHRNYQRNLKSLPSAQQSAQHNHSSPEQTTARALVYNPLELDAAGPDQQREGARRVAAELHRRIDKSQQRDRKRKQNETDDASGINLRNKRFNEKINRTYDKQTAEIRQNLERGTAL